MNLQKTKKYILITLAILVFLIIAAISVVLLFNKPYLELNLTPKTLVLEYGVDQLPKVNALYKGHLLNKKGKPVKTAVEGSINTEKLGTYTVTYVANYKGHTLKEKRTFQIVDTLPPEIKLNSDPKHFTSPGAEYVEEGYTAIDLHDGDLTDKVVREVTKDLITYTVTDSSGNTANVNRKIIYKDTTPPVITLNEGNEIRINTGQTFVDPGFVATDDYDGDITSSVSIEGTVDVQKNGTYLITYRATDSSGNTGEIQRTVIVGDFTSPVILLQGESRMYIKVGTPYTEPGFSATDNMDGDITMKVSVTGTVDTSKMGRNNITYTVTDTAGNTTSISRSVLVYEKQATSTVVNPGDKVVYLTFDDGPSAYTSRLLDILDKYEVKATFFVTNQFPAYQNMIGETYRRGHTIALHTYNHQYNSIYCSEDAYYQDLEMIKNICVNQTGVTPTIVRFPGGTNNTISRNICAGIMTALSQSLSYHGYLYCDWNVSSGDAGGANTTALVSANVIAGIQRQSVSVVLQHDIKSFSVEAVDEIIFWGLENGYRFLPLTDSSPMVHFAPQN